MNINFLSTSELAVKIASSEISSRRVVEAFIKQVRSQNPTWNAIVFLNEREALRQADQADQDLAVGKSHGLLHGVPITVKDTYAVKGIPVTSGYPPLKNFIPDDDAVIVRRLKDEGAIILGKTNTAVLAMDMQTDNPVFGRTNNPWDITRTPAGSSGGCAAALASGMTPLSFGSDLAGSIRVPAAFCGVYGFKPTHGVLSLKGHIPPLPGEINGSRMLAVPGPLGRSVEDIILAMTILSKPNPYDRFVAPLAPDPSGAPGVKDLKIAWSDNFGNVPVSREIKHVMNRFLEKLAKAGAMVEQAEPAGIDYEEIWELWGALVGMQGRFKMPNFMRATGDFFTRGKVKHVPMHRNIVGPISVGKLMEAIDLQSKYVTIMDNFLSRYDAWISPVSSGTAFRHHPHSKRMGEFKIYDRPLDIDGRDVHYYVATQSFTTVFTTTCSPVLSMPAGIGESGMPVNLQVSGRRHEDFRLLNVARVLGQYAEKINYPVQEGMSL